ncbi:conjugative transfer protein MobI(A/C), partial [Escherichia coli]
MSNSKLIKSLELSRSLMRSQIEALREEAEDLCTNYWIEWKERNHLEINLPRPSNTLKREYLGSYAPKLELIGNAKKVTITWHKFSPFKTRAPSYMSKRVSAMKNGIYGHSRFCNTDFDDK